MPFLFLFFCCLDFVIFISIFGFFIYLWKLLISAWAGKFVRGEIALLDFAWVFSMCFVFSYFEFSFLRSVLFLSGKREEK